MGSKFENPACDLKKAGGIFAESRQEFNDTCRLKSEKQ
jgi:hypothetical protein